MEARPNFDEEHKKVLDTIEVDSFEDRAYGTIMGAFIADAMGSYLEFNTQFASEDQMDECMKMPGGGPYKLASGQFTDDSELAMMCMHAIVNSNKDGGKGVLVKNELAKSYRDWIESPPFDIGGTTRNGLGCLVDDCDWNTSRNMASGYKSASNGGIMRMTPLSVWGSKISDPGKLYELVKTDQCMTHSNMLVQLASFFYSYAIQSLIKNRERKNRAFIAYNACVQLAKRSPYDYSDYKMGTDIKRWLELAERLKDKPINGSILNLRQEIGQCKYGFVLCFYYLLQFEEGDEEFRKNIYSYAMREIIQNGGDTDTNAAIVGGMLGALVGIKGIPEEYVQKSLAFDCTKEFTEDELGQPRPEFLSLKKVGFTNIGKLIACMPDSQPSIK